MTVLVTGGAGYIGSHMVWELLDHDEDVVVLDNLSTGFRWAVPEKVELIVGDVGDQRFVEGVLEKHKIDCIIHFAGSVVVPESMENPLKYYHNNTANSRNLVSAAVNAKVSKFIFSSTAAVYGAPMTTGPIREDAILNPMSPYGSSKLMTEIMVRDAANAHDSTVPRIVPMAVAVRKAPAERISLANMISLLGARISRSLSSAGVLSRTDELASAAPVCMGRTRRWQGKGKSR